MKIIPNFTNQTHTTCVFLVMYFCFSIYVFVFLCLCIVVFLFMYLYFLFMYFYVFMFFYLCICIWRSVAGSIALHLLWHSTHAIEVWSNDMSNIFKVISNILFCTLLTLCSKDKSALHKIVKIYIICLLNLVFTPNIC